MSCTCTSKPAQYIPLVDFSNKFVIPLRITSRLCITMRFVSGSGFHEFPVNSILPRASYALFLFLFLLDFFFVSILRIIKYLSQKQFLFSYLFVSSISFCRFYSLLIHCTRSVFFLFSEIRGESAKQGVIRLFRQHPGHFCLPYFHSWCATHKHIFIWHRSWCIFPFPGAVPEGITPFVMYDGVLVDIPPASLFFWDTPLLPPFSCFPPLAL